MFLNHSFGVYNHALEKNGVLKIQVGKLLMNQRGMQPTIFIKNISHQEEITNTEHLTKLFANYINKE